jgi:dual specificity phosphatase 3
VTATASLPPLLAGEPDPGWRPDYDRLRRRLAEQLATEGHPDPHAAAAQLVESALRRPGLLVTSPVMVTEEPYPTPMDHLRAPELPVATVANISFVTARLAVGGDLSDDDDLAEAQVAELVKLGITHIVDTRIEWNDEDLVADLAPGISYLHRGIDDDGQPIPDRWFEETFSWIAEAMADPETVVLTHCHMGINRGPSLGFATLLGLGWDPVDALDAIRRARPITAIAYASDALHWHHHRTGCDVATRQAEIHALAGWRKANGFDVGRIIRQLRGSGP